MPPPPRKPRHFIFLTMRPIFLPVSSTVCAAFFATRRTDVLPIIKPVAAESVSAVTIPAAIVVLFIYIPPFFLSRSGFSFTEQCCAHTKKTQEKRAFSG